MTPTTLMRKMLSLRFLYFGLIVDKVDRDDDDTGELNVATSKKIFLFVISFGWSANNNDKHVRMLEVFEVRLKTRVNILLVMF